MKWEIPPWPSHSRNSRAAQPRARSNCGERDLMRLPSVPKPWALFYVAWHHLWLLWPYSLYLLLASSAVRGPPVRELATVRNVTNAACPSPGTAP